LRRLDEGAAISDLKAVTTFVEKPDMNTHTMRQQLRDNLVAVTSLAVAVSALGYNTWRNEVTERNRNVRVAGIEILKEIGSLQQIVFHVRFTDDRVTGGEPRPELVRDLRMGWVDVFTIGDLAVVMPPEVARDAAALRAAWEQNVAGLVEDQEAFARIDGAIERLRRSTVESLRRLR
jgi:hypothetical protein